MNRKGYDGRFARWLLGVMVVVMVSVCAQARQIDLDVAVGTPVLPAGEKQTAYLRVAMTGFEVDKPEERTPVNVAIVLDKSGSMQGDKLARAKDAAIKAIQRLDGSDIVSVVTYDSTVNVLVPATKVSDRENIFRRIRTIQAGNSTALFAGVSKGAAEVRKFLGENRVNRIILLSDGLANVGPQSPGALADLGASLGAEGIAVSTLGLGLGYNEDLMTQLASASDGNHMFVENARDLEVAFDREFRDVLSVVAQDVNVRIRCGEGIRPVRVLGREADIVGQTVVTSLNQLYSDQMKYILLEVEVPASAPDKSMKLAAVDVSYANMQTKATDRLSSSVSVTFTESASLVEAKTNKDVMASAIRMIGVERNAFATRLRDEGKIDQAREVLYSNEAFLVDNAEKFESEELQRDAMDNRFDANNLDDENWKRQRKVMVYNQKAVKTQQSK